MFQQRLHIAAVTLVSLDIIECENAGDVSVSDLPEVLGDDPSGCNVVHCNTREIDPRVLRIEENNKSTISMFNSLSKELSMWKIIVIISIGLNILNLVLFFIV